MKFFRCDYEVIRDSTDLSFRLFFFFLLLVHVLFTAFFSNQCTETRAISRRTFALIGLHVCSSLLLVGIRMNIVLTAEFVL